MGKPNYNVVMCHEGWKKLYQPIIDDIVHHDISAMCNEEKIGVMSVQASDGQMEIQLINDANASAQMHQRITNAEQLSMKMCEYCGNTSQVGTTMNFFYKTCCKSCWEKEILPKFPQSIWKNYATNVHHKLDSKLIIK